MIGSARLVNNVRYFSQQAINIRLFQERFNQLPGDYSRGVAVLGATGAGDGNGVISAGESTLVYEHMYRAGFVKELYNATLAWSVKYTRFKFESDLKYVIVTTMDNSGGNWGGVSDAYDYNSFLVTTDASGWNNTGALMPKTAFTIDAKIDDGSPGTGLVRGRNANTTGGASTGCRTNTPSVYREAQWTVSNLCIFYIALTKFDG